MQPDRAERVAEIVDRALETQGDERAKLMAELCGNDSELRQEAESLLNFEAKARGFIESPAYESAAHAFVEGVAELRIGQTLGDCKILSLLGEGGMGEVYLAEDQTLGRQVAIKVVKSGLGTSNIIRHFRKEEQILASLTHPNIARLYGGGVTADGLPYFVMEYADGPRVDNYCREKQLPINSRLELFRKICSAISYAHQHLVIHRDIKPGNIRVTAEGEPKLLDFGIAKLLDPETSTIGEPTMTLGAVMTPQYASPEQVRGESMTTASDVYSLGVVLYELLTGQKPYKIDNFTPAKVARAITEQEATRPSTAVTKGDAGSTSEVGNRKLLRGDLDNIVMKALRKEPERRYTSVGQFSEDIRRHLDGRPVIARKDTVGYRTSKFIARNRIAVSATVLVLLAIVAGLIAALWQAQMARQQRDVADREKSKAQDINTFLQEMLGAAAPEAKGVDVKVADVLSEASRRAKADAASHPDVMADVLMTLGRTYISLGLFEPAATDLRAAVAASSKANGEMNSTTATSLGWLGLVLGDLDQSKEGESISRKAVLLQRRLHPEGNADLGVALYSLGLNLVANGEPRTAIPLLEESSALIEKHLGKNHGYFLSTLTALAVAHERSGDAQGAETLYRRSIELGRTAERRYRIFLAQASGYLGSMLIDRGAYADAETALRESEQVYREVGGDSSVAMIQTNLGRLYNAMGDYARAEIEFRKALELLPKYFPADHYFPADAKFGLGLTLTRTNRAIEGEPYLREALATRKRIRPKGDATIYDTQSALGECLCAQQRFADAEPLLIEGYEGLKATVGEQNRHTIEARKRLANLYQGWGKADIAGRFQ